MFAWISLWPLFYMAERFKNSWKKLFFAGASASFFLCLFAFYWVIYTFTVFGGIHWLISSAIFVPYTLLLNLKFPVFMILFGISRRNHLKKYLPPAWFTAATIALFSDFLTPQVFDWYWGNLLAGNNIIAQIAEITGIYGLTFLLFAADYALFYRLLSVRRIFIHLFHPGPKTAFRYSPVLLHGRAWKRLHTHLRIWPATGMLLFVILFGIYRKLYFEDYQKSLPTLRIALIQPNTPLERPGGVKVLTRQYIENIMNKIIPDLAEKAWNASGESLDLILLPESAVPYYTTQDTQITRGANLYSDSFRKMAENLALKYNTNVFLNEIAVEPIEVDQQLYPGMYNATAFFSRAGIRESTYYKRVLVAFGEYVPLFSILENIGLSGILPAAIRFSGFQHGSVSNTISVSSDKANSGKSLNPGVKEIYSFIPLICYEVLFPEHVRSFFTEDQHPGFIVNLTQDGWYAKTAETYQHYELGRIRSIEFRKALARSTNTGTSGFVDLAGNYMIPVSGKTFSPLYEPYIQVGDLPVDNRSYITLYARFGNAWMLIILFLFFAHTAFHIFKRKFYAGR